MPAPLLLLLPVAALSWRRVEASCILHCITVCCCFCLIRIRYQKWRERHFPFFFTNKIKIRYKTNEILRRHALETTTPTKAMGKCRAQKTYTAKKPSSAKIIHTGEAGKWENERMAIRADWRLTSFAVPLYHLAR